ncbi:M16 family metallopeptidase [Streptomyces sp. 3214.6]|uniref:M16 family metallopeptidase n=1 Tax=Streptomyces sp. 3214.6 TaxID=1882757 RepID=UPI00090B09FF|nr:insulinase family protein [Streptomyces sp. 3214.6]SHI08585.1 Predicted Zn-dependent peptidase [Streptomyces sp. 3214.6]
MSHVAGRTDVRFRAVADSVVDTRLPNGIRVGIVQDPLRSCASLCITHGGGHRAEPWDKPGIAHLVEHLALDVSDSSPTGHLHRVQALGGVVNAYTGRDYTQFFSSFPIHALPAICDAEAARLADPTTTPANTERQLRIIRQEVLSRLRGNGGFPDIYMPAELYANPANAHSGFLDNQDLQEVANEELTSYLRATTAPKNTTVTLVTPQRIEQALACLEAFGAIVERSPLRLPRLQEPGQGTARTTGVTRDGVTAVEAAFGFRLVSPGKAPARFLSHVVLADMLISLLVQDASLGLRRNDIRTSLTGLNAFSERTPVTSWLSVRLRHPDHRQRCSAVLEGILAAVANDPDQALWSQAKRDTLSLHRRVIDSGLRQARLLGWLLTLHDWPDGFTALSQLISEVSLKDIAIAAEELAEQPFTQLVLTGQDANA